MLSTIDNLTLNYQGKDWKGINWTCRPFKCEAYGQNMKLKDLASVTVPESRTIK